MLSILSIVIPTSFFVSSKFFPCPINFPAFLFLLCSLKHVTIKSPRPLNPYKVSFCPPNATPNLDNSASPLVIKAANVLSPKPIPAATPAQNAMIFFKAPPNSTPFTSLDV